MVLALALLAFVFVVRDSAPERGVAPATPPPAITGENHPGFLYGRIAVDGATYEGRLRFGGDQEAFWGDYFDGFKPDSPWAVHAPGGGRHPLEIFGVKIGDSEGPNLSRQFMARFGDLARVEVNFRTVKVTLKSGTTYELDRFSAGDVDDGLRVWDGTRGVIDVDARDIRTIQFLPTPPLANAPGRLHGTVRTRLGDFTGFIAWDRQEGVSTDELQGRASDGERSLRYDTIRSIARRSRVSALVTLRDGREMLLSDTRDVGAGSRGIYVDDARYGRVLIDWEAFERVEFSPRDSGPAYGDFPPGRPLAGIVTTRDGRRLAGRLVYDFDESETTETFDVSGDGVDYNIPFGLIASIVPTGRVTLHDGEALSFALNPRSRRNGDLGEGNAGLLIFVDGRQAPEYVPWADVERVDLDPPSSGDR